MRKVNCRNDCIILNAHLMVVLILFLEATEDGNALRRGRLINHHHLETALKSLVLLKILLVLVQSSCTNRTQLTARKSRL